MRSFLGIKDGADLLKVLREKKYESVKKFIVKFYRHVYEVNNKIRKRTQSSVTLDERTANPLNSKDLPSEAVRKSQEEDGKRCVRYKVDGDGDCGYTAFGITRNEAYQLLRDNLNDAKVCEFLKKAFEELLLEEDFLNYLKEKELIAAHITLEDIQKNFDQYTKDTLILLGMINYDIKEKQGRGVDAGWAHPAVLQALAHIQHLEIRMWRLGEDGSIVPHRRQGGLGDFDYASYKPQQTKERVDLLFVGGNHFERLEFQGYEDQGGFPSEGETVYPGFYSDLESVRTVSPTAPVISHGLKASSPRIAAQSSSPLCYSLDELSRRSRRLDSMARLLVGDETCAAVCLVKQLDGKIELWCATNQNAHSTDTATERGSFWQRISFLFEHLSLLATHLHQSKRGVISSHGCLKELRLNFLLEALPPYLKGKCKINTPSTAAALSLFLKSAIEDFNTYLESAPLVKGDICDDWLTKYQEQLKKNPPSALLQKNLKNILTALKRYLQDIIKLETFFSDRRECAELAEAFAEKRISPRIIDRGEAGVHAEMRIIAALIHEKVTTPYIGINKLCCAYCTLVVNRLSMEEIFDPKNISDPVVRGFHGNPYPWPIVDELLSEPWREKWLTPELSLMLDGLSTQEKPNFRCVALDCLRFLPLMSVRQLRVLDDSLQKLTPCSEAADSSINCSQTKNRHVPQSVLKYLWVTQEQKKVTSNSPPPEHPGHDLGYRYPFSVILVPRAESMGDLSEGDDSDDAAHYDALSLRRPRSAP